MGPKGAGKARPGRGTVVTESVRPRSTSQLQMSDFTIPTEVHGRLNRKLARVRPTLAHGNTRVPTRIGNTAASQFRPAPSFERNRGAGVICYRGLAGHSFNDEQWGEDLFIPSSH